MQALAGAPAEPVWGCAYLIVGRCCDVRVVRLLGWHDQAIQLHRHADTCRAQGSTWGDDGLGDVPPSRCHTQAATTSMVLHVTLSQLMPSAVASAAQERVYQAPTPKHSCHSLNYHVVCRQPTRCAHTARNQQPHKAIHTLTAILKSGLRDQVRASRGRLRLPVDRSPRPFTRRILLCREVQGAGQG